MKSLLFLIFLFVGAQSLAQIETSDFEVSADAPAKESKSETTKKETTKSETATTVIEAPAVGESICKKGDLKGCAKALKDKVGTPEFRASYDQVCLENKNFRCVKITIRGEPNEEMKYQMSQNPKAHLFPAKEGSEDKIYLLEAKGTKK